MSEGDYLRDPPPPSRWPPKRRLMALESVLEGSILAIVMIFAPLPFAIVAIVLSFLQVFVSAWKDTL